MIQFQFKRFELSRFSHFRMSWVSVALLLIANLLTTPSARTDEPDGPSRKPAVLGPATELPTPGENGLNYLDYTDELPAAEAAGESVNSETQTGN